jgi:hypothetical protein
MILKSEPILLVFTSGTTSLYVPFDMIIKGFSAIVGVLSTLVTGRTLSALPQFSVGALGQPTKTRFQTPFYHVVMSLFLEKNYY